MTARRFNHKFKGLKCLAFVFFGAGKMPGIVQASLRIAKTFLGPVGECALAPASASVKKIAQLNLWFV